MATIRFIKKRKNRHRSKPKKSHKIPYDRLSGKCPFCGVKNPTQVYELGHEQCFYPPDGPVMDHRNTRTIPRRRTSHIGNHQTLSFSYAGRVSVCKNCGCSVEGTMFMLFDKHKRPARTIIYKKSFKLTKLKRNLGYGLFL